MQMDEQKRRLLPGRKRKPGTPLVSKPYLKGRAFGKTVYARGLRVLGFLLITCLIHLILGQFLAVEISWLRAVLNVSVLLSTYALMYMDGARIGEGDLAFAEIALARQSAGKPADENELARCYHPFKGFVTAAAGAFPVFLLCLAYALVAVRESYTLGTLPSWLKPYLNRADIGLALSYYQQNRGLGFLDFLRVAVRLLVFPFINLAGGNRDAILLVERLSPLLALLAPLSYGFGYTQGEKRRALVHGSIAANTGKSARKQRKKPRPPSREPRQLV